MCMICDVFRLIAGLALAQAVFTMNPINFGNHEAKHEFSDGHLFQGGGHSDPIKQLLRNGHAELAIQVSLAVDLPCRTRLRR